MREFTQRLLTAFSGATGWSQDNSYSELNAAASDLLQFPIPSGLQLSLSSLATPHFATSYRLGSVGAVDGSVAYLYSSVPLTGFVPQSDRVPLLTLLRSYRPLRPIPLPPPPASSAPSAGRHGTLLYGQLYLPHSCLEGLAITRLAPRVQLQLRSVSDAALRNGGTLLGLLQYDEGRFGVEGLASTDGGLLGLRGVYNWGGDAAAALGGGQARAANEALGNDGSGSSSSSSGSSGGQATAVSERDRDRERIYGRFSAGGELYYGTLNKSGGVSLGARFATLPAYRGTPLTATLTVNPLVGSLSATYAVVARRYCSLATVLDFNVYSYESDWAVGMELWGQKWPRLPDDGNGLAAAGAAEGRLERSFQARLEWRLDEPEPETAGAATGAKLRKGETAADGEEQSLGVIKARLNQALKVGLLWEGRFKALLFSLGTDIDLKQLDSPFRSLGLSIQYSS